MDAREKVDELLRASASRAISDGPSLFKTSALFNDADLHYVREHHGLTRGPHKNGSRLKRRIKAIAGKLGSVGLSAYLDEEAALLVHLVRFQNSVADRIDQIIAELTWQREALIECLRVAERAEQSHRLLEERVRLLEREERDV